MKQYNATKTANLACRCNEIVTSFDMKQYNATKTTNLARRSIRCFIVSMKHHRDEKEELPRYFTSDGK